MAGRLTMLRPRVQALETQTAPRRPKPSAPSPYTYQWQQARLRFLREHPLCVMCERDGRAKGASVVDHRVPHKGDPVLFWDESNWQSLCKTHHDSEKQSEEKSGRRITGYDIQGNPLDPAHPWNRPSRD